MSELEENLEYLILGRRGGANRARILEQLRNGPANTNQLATNLDLNYRTVQHHVKLLMDHGIIRMDNKGGYGDIYQLDKGIMEDHSFLDNLILRASGKSILEGSVKPSNVYKKILSRTSDAVAVLDKNWKIVMANKSFEDLVGSPKTLKGEKAGRFFGPDVLANGGVRDVPAVMHDLTGSEVEVSLTMDVLKDDLGETTGYSLVVSDDVCPSPDLRGADQTRALENYAEILDMIPSGIVVMQGSDGRISYMNRKAEELYGRRLLDLPLERHSEAFRIFDPSGNPYPSDELPASRSLLKGETVDGVELLLEQPDGSMVKVIASSTPLFDQNGDITGAVASFKDITGVSDVRDRLRTILDSIPVGIKVTEVPGGKVFYSNKMAEGDLGKGKGPLELYNLSGVPIPGITLPSDLSRSGRAGEDRILRKPGDPDSYVLIKSNAVRDEGGKTRYVVTATTPITEIKRLQETLESYQSDLEVRYNELVRSQMEMERARNEYFDLFDTSPVGFFKLDPFGLVTDANKAGCSMLGMVKTHLLNRPMANMVSGKDESRVRQYLRDVIQRRERGTLEVYLVGSDGVENQVYMTARPVTPPREDFACMAVCIAKDGDLLTDESEACPEPDLEPAGAEG